MQFLRNVAYAVSLLMWITVNIAVRAIVIFETFEICVLVPSSLSLASANGPDAMLQQRHLLLISLGLPLINAVASFAFTQIWRFTSDQKLLHMIGNVSFLVVLCNAAMIFGAADAWRDIFSLTPILALFGVIGVSLVTVTLGPVFLTAPFDVPPQRPQF